MKGKGGDGMPRKRIAVLTARADDYEQRTVLSGIAAAAFSINADVVVYSNLYNFDANAPLHTENQIYDVFQPQDFDGVIVTAEAFWDLTMLAAVFDRIRAAGIPAVMIDGTAAGFQTVRFDDAAEMEEIVEHLITVHGLTKFDILTGPADTPASKMRLAGCRNAFARHGIAFDEKHIHYGNFWTDAGEQLAKRYLHGDFPLPEAVICTNDYMAYGLCDALTTGGILIPEQLTVTGYDYTDSRIYHHPILTTYRRNRHEIGANAVALLFPEEVILAPISDGLIPGNTCRCGVVPAQVGEEIRAARIGQFHVVMSSVAQFTSRLTLCRTLADYMAVLQEFFYLLHGADGLCLVLDQAWNREAYEGEQFLRFSIGEGQLPEAPLASPPEDILPALLEERDCPMVFYFSPLCFQERLFGYTVLSYAHPQGYDFSFRDWNKNVANTLELLRMKNDIHYLRQCQRVSAQYDSLTGFYHLREFRKIVETLRTEVSGDCCLQAVQLCFPDDGTYFYGENYRSDILAAAARAVKQATVAHEICCLAAEGLFLVLCRQEEGQVFSEKLRVMLHHAICQDFGENQVLVTYAAYTGRLTNDCVDAVCRQAETAAAEALTLLQTRQAQPHYKALLAIRDSVQKSPKDAPATESVCKQLCISDGYFRVSYKACFGVSYVQDVIHARTMLACYLLCTTAMSIYTISRTCGYADEKYFARQFRQSTGCSPMQFRETYC